ARRAVCGGSVLQRLRRHIISHNTDVRPKPTTEMIVSMTDHVLMVSPMVIPKYSLTSQNPASLTCEKNNEPAPIANTTRAVWAGDSPAANGATIPEAVTVATVADPVASRTSTATSQPRNSADRLSSTAALPMATPVPPPTNTALKPPPAPTMMVGLMIGFRLSPHFAVSVLAENPTFLPKVISARSTATNRATTGSPMNCTNG